jgi:hypothetical protein
MCVPTSFLLPAIRAFCRAPSASIFFTILIAADPLACGLNGLLDKRSVLPYLRLMKTTIEIPETIAHQAKIVAAERRTTLRGLVLQGLEHILAEKQVKARDRAKKLFAEMDKLPAFVAKNRLSRSDANAR